MVLMVAIMEDLSAFLDNGHYICSMVTIIKNLLAFLNNDCSDSQARSDPVGESEPKLGDARLMLFIHIFFNFIFQKCCDPNPGLDSNGGSKLELGLLRRFYLSYQNTYLCHFISEFSFTRKHFKW